MQHTMKHDDNKLDTGMRRSGSLALIVLYLTARCHQLITETLPDQYPYGY